MKRFPHDPLSAGTVCLVMLSGCHRHPPTPAPPASAPTDAQPSDAPARPEPARASAEPEHSNPLRPTIPDGPVAGTLDGQPFDLAQVIRDGSTVTFAAADGRGVTLAFFSPDREIEVLAEPSFGSPHLYVRSPAAATAQPYVNGYRLIYSQAKGELWLTLPDGRGEIAGHFRVE
ncbi:MAG: hypothetical protein Kow0022_17410 [Phycisphaerales bacterium]